MRKTLVISALLLGSTFFNPSFADGKSIYQKSCQMCHASGMAGAPKVGDKAAWKERISKGDNVLVKNAIDGLMGPTGMMPPKGGNPKLSDDEVKAAVMYMLSASK